MHIVISDACNKIVPYSVLNLTMPVATAKEWQTPDSPGAHGAKKQPGAHGAAHRLHLC